MSWRLWHLGPPVSEPTASLFTSIPFTPGASSPPRLQLAAASTRPSSAARALPDPFTSRRWLSSMAPPPARTRPRLLATAALLPLLPSCHQICASSPPWRHHPARLLSPSRPPSPARRHRPARIRLLRPGSRALCLCLLLPRRPPHRLDFGRPSSAPQRRLRLPGASPPSCRSRSVAGSAQPRRPCSTAAARPQLLSPAAPAPRLHQQICRPPPAPPGPLLPPPGPVHGAAALTRLLRRPQPAPPFS